MDHIELLAESVIKLEEIKQEPEDSIVEPVWNSTIKQEPEDCCRACLELHTPRGLRKY
ncbi:hypothetical protein R5R35_005827 [Gryllus longicercus]|uniref:Uncharacterized protein n=1 Tax=Gryllus longicercus TaxID=2509291 RepID=A0AAN9VCW3_9ORTH